MKFSLKSINKPTPTIIKHIADSVQGALGSTGIAMIVNSHPTLGAAFVIVGFVSKVLSNFFSHSPLSSK